MRAVTHAQGDLSVSTTLYGWNVQVFMPWISFLVSAPEEPNITISSNGGGPWLPMMLDKKLIKPEDVVLLNQVVYNSVCHPVQSKA